MNVLRKLVNDFVRAIRIDGIQRQSCKRCGAIDYMNFDVPDEIWNRVAGKEWACRVLCLACFDDMAVINDVDYAAFVSQVLFVGNRCGLEMEVKTARSHTMNRQLAS